MISLRQKMKKLGVLFACVAVAVGLTAQASYAGSPTKAQSSGANSATAASAGGINNIPRIGVETFALSDLNAPAAKASGAGLVRIQMSWNVIQSQPSTPASYDWRAYDDVLLKLSQNGVSPLVTIVNCPLWACIDYSGPLLTDKYGDFAQFMGAAASRYSVAPYNVHYWEFWNEPDGAGGQGRQAGWGSHPAEYAAMLQRAYTNVKAIDPQSGIIMGGLAFDNWWYQGGPFNPDFLAGVLQAGGGSYVDAVAFHYYKANAHGWTNLSLKTVAVRAVLTTNGSNLPLMCSETGLTSDPAFGSSEEYQARYLVLSNLYAAADGLLTHVWFLLKDYTHPSPKQQLFTKSGLLRLDDSQKPAYYAQKTLADEIGNGSFVRSLDTNDAVSGNLQGYKFLRQASGLPIWVVWSAEGTESTLRIAASDAVNVGRVVSMTGAVIQAPRDENGDIQITVGSNPVYVEWLNRFVDVPGDAWSYPYIEYLASRGVIGGYSDGTFRPNATATRQQFAKMATLGLGLPLSTPTEARFTDVSTDSQFFTYVESAYANGLVGGYPCGAPAEPCDDRSRAYFRPGANVTRGQIAKILVLARGWALENPSTATFQDVPIGSTFFNYIETAVKKGVVSGYGNGTFQPSNNATRAQLSKMLALSIQTP